METYARNQFEFRALAKGNKGDEVIVLLHGFPADAQSWLPVANQLAKNHYRVLIPEQRGYSPQARPASRRAYKLDELVEDTMALITAEGAKSVHLVGHDWGGSVAWALAGKYPQAVSSLIVVSTPHPAALSGSLWRSRQLLLSAYMLFFQLPRLPEWLLTTNHGAVLIRSLTKSGLNPRSASRYTHNMQEKSLLTSALNWYRAIPLNLASPKQTNTIKPRTLFIYGGKDRFLSYKSAQLTGSWVVGPYEFKYLPQESHWLPEESPELLARMIQDFIVHS